MRRVLKTAKKILAGTLAVLIAMGSVPDEYLQIFAEETKEYSLDNGYIKVDVSAGNGGFYISTVEGDKINKDDNNKSLLFHSDSDDTSFTSFQITRDGETKEYIFGESYINSSAVEVSEKNGEIISEWTVDDITFTQNIRLVNQGSSEHGMVYISYNAKNKGKDAGIKARLLLDTALGSQDYAYYNTGNSNSLVEQETTIGEDGYNKSFYGYNDPFSPTITSYIVNASVDNAECKPYQTTFAHWNNLAATVFDYTADGGMTFTNPNNKDYLTADSAFAMYYDFGEITKGDTKTIATNYGVYSNAEVKSSDTVAVNITAPSAMELNEEKTAYKEDGYFTIKTAIQNVSEDTYERVRVVVYTNAGITPLDDAGNETQATYDNPYTVDYLNFTKDQRQTTEWKFRAVPMEEGQYATVHYKVYDVSSDKTLNTDSLLADNLIGEGSTYILCPGSINEVPKIQFTSSSPEILYYKGQKTFNITGSNFSMLQDKSSYQVLLSRVDKKNINGKESIVIPSENFKIDAEKNTIAVVLNDDNPGEIPEGQYQLTIDYTQAEKEDITAPALRFTLSSDARYRNDTYGVLAVQKINGGDDEDDEDNDDEELSYSVCTYKDEDEYKSAINDGIVDREDCLLEFRGIFTKNTDEETGKITYTGISLNDDDNVMTLNNCLDIKNGTTIITEQDGSVKVDFDAKIITTGAGTGVWKGVCALTELEKGKDYGLILYEENGERDEEFDSETIALLWPSVGQAAQNMLGLIMDFKYGELGVIHHENAEETRVVAFGASLDTDFLSKDSMSEMEDSEIGALGKIYEKFIKEGDIGPDTIRNINKKVPYNTDTVNTNANSGNKEDDDDEPLEFSGSIQIDDVLFGGKYLGVCFTVEIGVPAFVDGMPEIEGELTVRTVGDWELEVSGECEFEMFCLEAEVAIKSRGNIVVPDKFRIFLGDIKPGINVDGFGILWLQGAGGGIDNLYDTIFLTEAVPPLQLLIEAQFSLMQIISARASLQLSLRGIGVELSEGTLLDTFEVLESAKVEFEWYPEFYFMSSINMNILGAIKGSGYIVAEQSGFFEFFIRAALQVPDEVPVLGGIEVASAGIGANVNKMWGKVSMLGVDLGVVYYWGKKIEWGGGDAAEPTYPDLIGMSSGDDAYDSGNIPVYYDEENDKTLYMRVGTNMVNTTKTRSVSKFYNDGINDMSLAMPMSFEMSDAKNMANSTSANKLQSLVTGREHLLTLGAKTKDEMLTLTWESESKEDAQKVVNNISIVDNDDDKQTYEIKLVDKTKPVDNQTDANANLTYDSETKTAMLAITFADEKSYERTWRIISKEAVKATLYDLEELPELSEDTKIKSVENGKMSLSIKGTQINKYDNILFTVIRDGEEEGTIIYKQDVKNLGDGNITFDMPDNLVSGDYVLRITASDEEGNYYSSVDKTFTYENKNEPSKPSSLSVKNAGNYRMEIDIESKNTDADGYCISVYDDKGNAVAGLNKLMYTSDGNAAEYDDEGKIIKGGKALKSVEVEVGGRYEYKNPDTNENTVAGLEAGKKYIVGVSSFKIADNGVLIYSNEKKSEEIVVEKPVETLFEISGDTDSVTISEQKDSQDGTVVKYDTPFYKSNDITLSINAKNESNTSCNITGKWILDEGNRQGDKGEFKNKNILELPLKDLQEGTHTLEITGENSHGDEFRYVYTFGVDTQGPRLLISSPQKGSLFDSTTGIVQVSGVTDSDTSLTIKDKDTGEIYKEIKNVEVDKSGIFATEIAIDTTSVSSTIVFVATDKVGNITQTEVELLSDAMGKIQSIDIYSEDMLISDKVISSGATYPLALVANLSDGSQIDITDSKLAQWNQNTIGGDAQIVTDSGETILKVGEDAVGMITARFRVSDAGSYSVSSAFKNTGETDIKNAIVKLTQTNYFTGEKIKVKPEVWLEGNKLTEGIDYSLSYSNNVNVTSEKKAVVTITGQGEYKGNISKEYDIIYLDASEKYTVSGIDGDNGWSLSGVKIKPVNGYYISDTSQTEGYSESSVYIKDEGKNVCKFYIKRISDGAISDKIEINTKVDSSLPEGYITLDRKTWKRFTASSAFTPYKLVGTKFGISATDKISGVSSIKYYMSDTIYDDVEELINSKPEWTTYDKKNQPEAKEAKKMQLYVKITDKAGNAAYLSSDGILMDTRAPKISDVSIVEDDTLMSVQADITFKVSEAGTYYYAMVPSNLAAPSADDIISGDILEAICGNGKVTSKQSGQNIRCTVTGLHKDTEYKLYMVAKDKAYDINTGKISPNISKVTEGTNVVKTRNETIDVSGDNISYKLSNDTYYTGKEITPLIVVKYGAYTLTEGVDYTVRYENNVDISSNGNNASVIITGIGDYSGEKIIEYEIVYFDATGKYQINSTKDDNGVYESADITLAEGYEMYDVRESEAENGVKTFAFRIRRSFDGAVSDTISIMVRSDADSEKPTETSSQIQNESTTKSDESQTNESPTGENEADEKVTDESVTSKENLDEAQQVAGQPTKNSSPYDNNDAKKSETENGATSDNKAQTKENEETKILDNEKDTEETTKNEVEETQVTEEKNTDKNNKGETNYILLVILGILIIALSGFIILILLKKKKKVNNH